MNVASLELCKQLYELSGWDKTWFLYTKTGKLSTIASMFSYKPLPAYDLGYLLRKLPRFLKDGSGLQLDVIGHSDWNVGYYGGQHDTSDYDWVILINTKQYWGLGPNNDKDKHLSIEDATCLLAIELFKQGILTHE